MHPIQMPANQSINQKIYLTIFMNTYNHTQQKLISRWGIRQTHITHNRSNMVFKKSYTFSENN